MEILYSLQGQSQSLWIDDFAGAAELFARILNQLREGHAELSEVVDLTVLVADGLLKEMADDAEQIELGELLASERPTPTA